MRKFKVSRPTRTIAKAGLTKQLPHGAEVRRQHGQWTSSLLVILRIVPTVPDRQNQQFEQVLRGTHEGFQRQPRIARKTERARECTELSTKLKE
jgi:hypothetical protein